MMIRLAARASLVWSGREDLNLRPLRPERSALPGCATPRQEREITDTGRGIVLQDRGKRQPMGIRHTLAGHPTVFEIHTLRQSGIGTNRPIDPVRREADHIR